MLKSASSDNPKDGRSELFAVRMALINSIVDPWIYILLRRENFILVSKLLGRVRKGVSVPASKSMESSDIKIDKTVSSSLHTTEFNNK